MKRNIIIGGVAIAFVLALTAIIYTTTRMNAVDATPAFEVREEGSGAIVTDELGDESQVSVEPTLVFPVEEYAERRWERAFGEYIDDGRFLGYHAADDVEFWEVTQDVPVVAIASGTVSLVDWVGGYGGIVKIVHHIDGKAVTAIYGHLDIESSPLSLGETVEMGAFIANLGADESSETDGARKHLHFGLYEGHDSRLQGYEPSATGVARWLNPTDVFEAAGLAAQTPTRAFPGESDFGTDAFPIAFTVPSGYEVEFVPQINALNIYRIAGEGTARERSGIFIRQFDASDFLTLNTVTIYSTEELQAGAGNYDARRYDIEKNASVEDFPYQPTWRNERHVVTDLRAQEGFSRFYVVAASPKLDQATYEAFLDSLRILE